MSTTIDIDDALLVAAMKATGVKTKQEAVEMALQFQIDIRRQKNSEATPPDQKAK